jgi:hypothetical protein
MGDTNDRGDLNTFIQAGQAAVAAARAIARLHGDRMVFVGWAAENGTGGFGGPDSPRRIADDAETSGHLIRLATNIASQAAVTILRSLLSGDQSREALASIAGVEGTELQRVLNGLHKVNLLYQPERGHYRLTANGEHAVGILFWAALQVRRPLPAQLNQRGWFDA